MAFGGCEEMFFLLSQIDGEEHVLSVTAQRCQFASTLDIQYRSTVLIYDTGAGTVDLQSVTLWYFHVYSQTAIQSSVYFSKLNLLNNSY